MTPAEGDEVLQDLLERIRHLRETRDFDPMDLRALEQAMRSKINELALKVGRAGKKSVVDPLLDFMLTSTYPEGFSEAQLQHFRPLADSIREGGKCGGSAMYQFLSIFRKVHPARRNEVDSLLVILKKAEEAELDSPMKKRLEWSIDSFANLEAGNTTSLWHRPPNAIPASQLPDEEPHELKPIPQTSDGFGLIEWLHPLDGIHSSFEEPLFEDKGIEPLILPPHFKKSIIAFVRAHATLGPLFEAYLARKLPLLSATDRQELERHEFRDGFIVTIISDVAAWRKRMVRRDGNLDKAPNPIHDHLMESFLREEQELIDHELNNLGLGDTHRNGLEQLMRLLSEDENREANLAKIDAKRRDLIFHYFPSFLTEEERGERRILLKLDAGIKEGPGGKTRPPNFYK